MVATQELCKEWNLNRTDGKAYASETSVLSKSSTGHAKPLCRLDNLLMRYEEPSSMVRWDSPLITIPWIDEDIPADDIWKAATEGNVKPPNVGTQAVRHILST